MTKRQIKKLTMEQLDEAMQSGKITFKQWNDEAWGRCIDHDAIAAMDDQTINELLEMMKDVK